MGIRVRRIPARRDALRGHYYQFRRNHNMRPWNRKRKRVEGGNRPYMFCKSRKSSKRKNVMRKIILPVLGAALAVSACQTMTPEERRARDEETCRSYGFRTGSEAFAQCLLELDLDRRAERRAQRDAFDDLGPSTVIYRPIIVRPRPKG